MPGAGEPVTGTDTTAEAIELALERQPRTVRQLQLATGVPMRQLRTALNGMARQGKVRVRHGLAGPEIIPTGNN